MLIAMRKYSFKRTDWCPVWRSLSHPCLPGSVKTGKGLGWGLAGNSYSFQSVIYSWLWKCSSQIFSLTFKWFKYWSPQTLDQMNPRLNFYVKTVWERLKGSDSGLKTKTSWRTCCQWTGEWKQHRDGKCTNLSTTTWVFITWIDFNMID